MQTAFFRDQLFSPNRILARLFTGWVSYTAFRLSENNGFQKLTWGQPLSLPILALWILGSFCLLSGIAFLFRIPQTDALFLWLAGTVCVSLFLTGTVPSAKADLFRVAVTVCYILLTVWTVGQNRSFLESFRCRGWTSWIAAFLAFSIAGIILSAVTCFRYLTFSSPNFDFGLFCNMFHHMKETGLPWVTSERDSFLSHFAVHISPAYYLFLPFYCLFPSPLTLQICQSAVLMLGVIPLLLLARHYRLSHGTTLILSLLYCFYPALSTGCFYDLHENCFLPLFLLLTFLFFEKNRLFFTYVSAILVLSVKEDAAVYLMIFAVYALLARKQKKTALGLLFLSVGYFLLSSYLLKTYGLGIMSNRFSNLIVNPDDGLLGVVKTVLCNPGYVLTQLFTAYDNTWNKVLYLIQLLLPLGLLPFCTQKASRWLLLSPLLINLLTYYQYQYQIGFQYSFGITAFLFYAMILNLPELSNSIRFNLLAVAFASCFCLYLALVLPKATYYTEQYLNGKEFYTEMETALETVPDDASVCCSSFLLAHLADRDIIYEDYYHNDVPDVDYVVLDVRYSDSKQTASAYVAQGYEKVPCDCKSILILKRADR